MCEHRSLVEFKNCSGSTNLFNIEQLKMQRITVFSIVLSAKYCAEKFDVSV